MKDFSAFQKRIGTKFNDEALLTQAFIHRSYLNEHRSRTAGHNERLEFLGDAVLELIVTHNLYTRYPHSTEGDMTAYRSALVNSETLSEVAAELGMEEYLYLSKGEAKDRGKARQYILANTFEALVGAIYLDQGYDAAKSFVELSLMPRTKNIVEEGLWSDAKSRFQEKAQEVVGVTPAYKVLGEKGPDHAKRFTVGVYLGREEVANGEGNSKQEAEQVAARNALLEKGWGGRPE